MEERLKEAVAKSKELPQKPSNDELLKLYGLFKQATDGDVAGERPGGFDFKAIAKFDTWAELKGMGKEDATEKYIALVDDLHSKYA